MAMATYQCRDCGHGLPLSIRQGEVRSGRVEVLIGVTDLAERLRRHVELNPEIHPSFVCHDE